MLAETFQPGIRSARTSNHRLQVERNCSVRNTFCPNLQPSFTGWAKLFSQEHLLPKPAIIRLQVDQDCSSDNMFYRNLQIWFTPQPRPFIQHHRMSFLSPS